MVSTVGSAGWIMRTFGRGFDASWKRNAFLAVFGAVMFFFPFSLLFVAGGMLPPRFSGMASFVIILNGIATLLSELRTEPVRRVITRFMIIAIALFAVEYVGVNSGFPFGVYAYTENLVFLAGGVPVAIAFAWYSTVINTWRIAGYWFGTSRPAVSVAVVAGILTLALDIALEPMAAFINRYWIWENNTVPVQNYLSWFVLSATAVFVLARTGRPSGGESYPSALVLFGSQVLLFVSTNAVNGYLLSSFVTLLILGAIYAVHRLSASGMPDSEAARS
jgi:uncharacterized membrane protein